MFPGVSVAGAAHQHVSSTRTNDLHIYIDESGVFKPASHGDAWSVVAAFVIIEKDERLLKQLVTQLKLACGKTYKDEIKLKDISEDRYISFLSALARSTGGTLYCTATDMSFVSDSAVIQHRDIQSEKIVEHKDKMHYETARTGLELLSDQVKRLSPQLYMQLVCQVNLIADVINRAILFYVQRNPKNLSRFRWRIDQKNTEKNEYEDAFEKVAPALLQSISLENPSIAVREFDYTAMSKFTYTKANAPNYLNECYGLSVNVENSLNVGKIMRDDLSFPDSKECIGVQVADLLASGIRRALRGQFEKLNDISRLLGNLMVQALKDQMPINLISFREGPIDNQHTKRVVMNFNRYSKAMLL